MIDAVCGQVYADLGEPAGQPGGWRGALTFIAQRNWDLFLRHPWLLHVLDGRPVLGPNINRKYEAELRPLDGIGLTDIDMDSVLTAGADARRGDGALAGRRCSRSGSRAGSPTCSGGRTWSRRWPR